jgi:methionyl-tRNA synthetase
MINKYFDGVVPTEATNGEVLVISEHNWPEIVNAAITGTSNAMERMEISKAAGEAMGLVRKVDAFINLTEPFKIAKDEARRDELGAILYQCLEALRIASLLLWPVLPERMEYLWGELGMNIDPSKGGLDELSAWGGMQPGTKVAKVALYQRMEQPEGLAVGGG